MLNESLEVSVFLLPAIDYPKMLLELLASHQTSLRSALDASGWTVNGRWTIQAPVPGSETKMQDLTVVRDPRGLRLVAPDLDLLPALPEKGVDFAAITFTVAEAGSRVLEPSAGSYRKNSGFVNGPAHAWRVMPGVCNGLSVRTVEVRARADVRLQSAQTAAKLFARVMNGRTPDISGADTTLRLDPWSEAGLTPHRV